MIYMENLCTHNIEFYTENGTDILIRFNEIYNALKYFMIEKY